MRFFFLMVPRPLISSLFPYTTLFRSVFRTALLLRRRSGRNRSASFRVQALDRKSTHLNSSHANFSYAVLCLKKKTLHPLTAAAEYSANKIKEDHVRRVAAFPR